MSKFVSNDLPEDLYQALRGDDLATRKEKVILVATIDANGWAHPAMLSYAEIVAKDRKNIRLATYKDSTTTNNMRRNSKLTVLVIDKDMTYYVKGTTREIKSPLEGFSMMNMEIEQVLEDKASEEFEPGAYISSGIIFYNPRETEFLNRGKKILRALLKA